MTLAASQQPCGALPRRCRSTLRADGPAPWTRQPGRRRQRGSRGRRPKPSSRPPNLPSAKSTEGGSRPGGLPVGPNDRLPQARSNAARIKTSATSASSVENCSGPWIGRGSTAYRRERPRDRGTGGLRGAFLGRCRRAHGRRELGRQLLLAGQANPLRRIADHRQDVLGLGVQVIFPEKVARAQNRTRALSTSGVSIATNSSAQSGRAIVSVANRLK